MSFRDRISSRRLQLLFEDFAYRLFSTAQRARTATSEDCTPALERNQTAVTLDALAVESISVEGDAVRLLQALTNVIDNAARFAPAGSVRVEVLLATPQAIVRVTDDGHGVTPNSSNSSSRW